MDNEQQLSMLESLAMEIQVRQQSLRYNVRMVQQCSIPENCCTEEVKLEWVRNAIRNAGEIKRVADTMESMLKGLTRGKGQAT